MTKSVQDTTNFDKKRWWILFFACLINLCIGSMYAWSSLSAPMSRELGQDLSAVFSVANAISFLAMILGGIFNDRFGPRWVMFVGGVMFGAGMATCAFAQNVWHLILSYGILLGLGMSFVYGCTISNTIKFFPDRRGMVGGMTTASYGISSVIFAPLSDFLASRVGARGTFFLLGCVFLVVICLGSLLMRRCPEGYLPQGFVPKAGVRSTARDKTPLEMLRSPAFYVMLLLLTCGGTFGLMVISGAKGLAIALGGVDAATATLFVSLLCLCNTLGRLVAGALSDRFGRLGTLGGALALAVLALGLLLVCTQRTSLVCFAAGLMLVGVCFGTFMGVFPGFCTDRFGVKYNTVNYGIMWIGFSAAGLAGPTILSSAFGATGSYASAFVLALALALAGILLTVLCRHLERSGS